MSGLDKMLKDAHQVLGEKEFLLTEINSLYEETHNLVEENHNSETFIQAIKTLGEWLKEPTVKTGMPLWIGISISLVAVATAVVTFFTGWPGLFGLALIVALLLYAYSIKSKHSDALNLRENDFIKSGS